MYLTGFADEAAVDIDGQIKATGKLGWQYIEARNVNETNIHDLSDREFDIVCGKLHDAGIKINGFGSTIANWSKMINEPFNDSLAEAGRAIPRMKRLGTKLIRIMSFAVLPDRKPDDQMEKERFKRLNALCRMFTDEGLLPLHENCMNYGGMGWEYTLRLMEEVSGVKLLFDTANPTLKAPNSPRQSSWEFYSRIKEHIAHVHVKDLIWDEVKDDAVYTFPGEGEGDVKRILKDLLVSGYDGGIAIEPHMEVVFHDSSVTAGTDNRFNNYIEYGRRLEELLADIRKELKL